MTGRWLRDLATGRRSTVDVGGLFVFAGGVTVLDGLEVTDEHGHVVTDATMRIAQAGLFAAGSIRSELTGQAVTAAGDGAAAAVAAHRYLETRVFSGVR